MKINKIIYGVLLVSGSLLQQLALAQDVDPLKIDKLFAMSFNELLNVEVTSVSKFEQKIAQAPASVLVITEEQIRDNLYHDLSDVLKDISFIDIVDNARGFGEYYTIKGIEGNDRFLVLIDGRKINSATGTFLSVGNSISVSFAKRIEIISGPSSIIYGADAVSGIINIISTEPSEGFKLSVNTAYGSYNSLYSNINAQFRFNKIFSILASVGLYHSRGPDFIDRDSVYNVIRQYTSPQKDEFEQPIKDHNIFIKAQYKNFAISYIKQRFNEGNAFGQQTSSVIYNKECKWAFTNNIIGVSYLHSFSNQSKLSMKLDYVHFEQDPASQFYKWQKDAFLEKSFNQYLTGKNSTIRGDINYYSNIHSNLDLIVGLEFENTRSIPPYANDQVQARPVKYEGAIADLIDEQLTIKQQRYAGYMQAAYTPLFLYDIKLSEKLIIEIK
ncbi:TonB-dependent receptor plug domain-containing protein [bacterium]|nr:TonB-dependent receptor plug domain-containing protein [bacterium]